MKKQAMAAILVGIVLVAGCGNKPEAGGTQNAQSFAAAAAAPAAPSAIPDTTTAANSGTTGGSALNESSVGVQVYPENSKDGKGAPSSPAATAPEKAAPAPEQSAPAKVEATAIEKPAAPTEAVKQPKEPEKAVPPANGTPEILWSEFFDNDKQNTPSDKFWNLKGKTVEIKGFMGEVLSFEKHWFLIIPKPGAECPFDNGDETYWNKIMIAYVPKDTKLRYTQGALKITGRLDVGIKLDESGYKTMFRLYDAHFEKIKE